MSRNKKREGDVKYNAVAPRERRVSRNSTDKVITPSYYVAPRERRVSRNVAFIVKLFKGKVSRLARGA